MLQLMVCLRLSNMSSLPIIKIRVKKESLNWNENQLNLIKELESNIRYYAPCFIGL
jgi:hypothetical protein